MNLTHADLAIPGICRKEFSLFEAMIGPEPFDARVAVLTYLDKGRNWRNILRMYQALVTAGRLREVGLLWTVAGFVFRDQPEAHAHLRKWGDTLNVDTWQAASAEADAAHDTARAAWLVVVNEYGYHSAESGAAFSLVETAGAASNAATALFRFKRPLDAAEWIAVDAEAVAINRMLYSGGESCLDLIRKEILALVLDEIDRHPTLLAAGKSFQ